jgi:hypothetical protein
LRQLLKTQYERDWHVDVDELVSKVHFLGYAARYIRRPPIAQHRLQEIDGALVKFLTKDTKSKETVLDAIPKEDFVQILAEHTPDKYRHAIRYYGLLSPRARARNLDAVFALLEQKRRPRPPRLSWAEMIIRYFGKDPLIDSRGRRMHLVGRYCQTAA